MSILHTTYLFDVNRFRDLTWPVIPKLLHEDYQQLRLLATEQAGLPHIWPILKTFGFYEDEFGNEEAEFETDQDAIRFWMMILLTSSLEPTQLHTPLEVERYYFPAMRQALAHLGNAQLVEKFLIGKPMYEMWHPDLIQLTSVQFSELPIWCKLGRTGWLHSEDIGYFLSLLLDNQDTVKAKIWEDDRKEEILTAYENGLILLTSAQEANLGLFQAMIA